VELDKERIENYLYQIAAEVADLEKVLEAPDREILADRIVIKILATDTHRHTRTNHSFAEA